MRPYLFQQSEGLAIAPSFPYIYTYSDIRVLLKATRIRQSETSAVLTRARSEPSSSLQDEACGGQSLFCRFTTSNEHVAFLSFRTHGFEVRIGKFN